MEENPYAANPEAAAGGSPELVDSEISQKALESLRRTKPWLTFLTVCGYIVLAVLGIIFIIGIIVEAGKDAATAFGLGIAFFIFLGLLLMLFLKLRKLSSSIGELQSCYKAKSLENALNAQRSFWKSIGIFTIVYLVIVIISSIAADSI